MQENRSHIIKEGAKRYNPDLSSESQWYIASPDERFIRFPFWTMESGYFDAGPRFATMSQSGTGYWLAYTIEGQGELINNSRRCVLGPHVLVVADCAGLIDTRVLGPGRWKYYWLWFNGDGMRAFDSLIFGGETLMIRDDKQLLKYFRKLIHSKPSRLLSTAVRDNQAYTELLSLVMEIGQKQQDRRTPGDYIPVVMNYIRDHWRDDLTIDQLAEIASVSKYHLIRAFKESSGITPYQYIINLRINHGQILLRTTDDSIQSIGEQLGYDSPSYFSQQFKQIVGVSPLEYRKASLYSTGQTVDIRTKAKRRCGAT